MLAHRVAFQILAPISRGNAKIMSLHSAACHLIHAILRKAAKGGGALHIAPDLVLVAADA